MATADVMVPALYIEKAGHIGPASSARIDQELFLRRLSTNLISSMVLL